MNKKQVFFTPWNEYNNMLEKFKDLVNESDLLACVQNKDNVAIKLHIGELGNPNYVRPFFIKALVDMVKAKGGKPFLTDTCTYYPLKRANAVDHIETSIANGFNFAPFIVADGLLSENGVRAESPDPLLSEVEVAGTIYKADCMLVVSHVKGHPLTGFGGAIKNLGMGCVTKKTKLEQHRLVDLEIDEQLCQGCGTCLEACWFGLPRIENEKAVIDSPYCMRCPICSNACPEGAISLKNKHRLNQGLAVASKGVLNTFAEDKIGYLSFATDISNVCDCANIQGSFLGPNVGIFAGFSPDSIDAAALKSIDYQKLDQMHNNDCWLEVKKMQELDQKGSLEPEIKQV